MAKKRTTQKLRIAFKLMRCYLYDMGRYFKHSGLVSETTDNLLSDISTTYHILEKGLAFDQVRIGFGRDKISKLVRLMKTYRANGGDAGNSQYVSAVEVLSAYVEFHAANDQDLNDELKEFLKGLTKFVESQTSENDEYGCGFAGGVKRISRNDYLKAAQGDFRSLSQNRVTIRSFSGEEISADLIRDVVKMAGKSPSTCHRQTSRVYLFSNRQSIDKILKVQKGTRGFSEQINKLLVVAGDLGACMGAGDRCQVYADSGIFAMSVLYGLQYRGVGACALHWNVTPKRDKALRAVADIADNHSVVCMIGIGALREEFKVPVSQRRALSDILIEEANG